MKNNLLLKVALIAAVMPMLLLSCATIVSGGSPKITIDGNITEPVTITTTKQTYQNVTLPYVVKVNRHKLDGQHIYIKSESTRYRDVVLEKATNGWAFGNILIGGLIGWGIDLGTNCVSKPAQTHFYINADDVQGGPAQQKNNYNNVVTGVEAP
jgi:hypothetical protein